MPFLPPNVDNDQSGMNPLMAALSPQATQGIPQAAPATGGTPTGAPAASGGGILSSLFGGGSASGMGNPIGNALVNSGGHLLLPLLGSLLGGRTPQQQAVAATLANKQAEGSAAAQGFAGLDDALTAAKGNVNRAIHTWVQTPVGRDYFVRGGKMADVKTYLETASPDGGMTAEQKNFNSMLDNAGITTPEGKALAAKQHLGLIKYVPRVTKNAQGVAVPTGEYDRIDTVTNTVTPVQAGTPEAHVAAVTTPAPADATPAPATGVPATSSAQTSGVPGPIVPFGAEIAESVGPVGGTVAAGGSLLSNAVPGAYPMVTQEHRKQVDQIEADAADLMNTFKRGGRGDVVAPLQDLSHISKANSPQEAVTMMINARGWMQDQLARNQAIVNDPRMANTDEGKDALTKLYALQGAISHMPPMTTQTLSDGTKIMGLQEEAQKLSSATNTSSPVGQYLGDLPGSLARIWNAGKDYATEAAGGSPAPAPKEAPAKAEEPSFANEKAVLDAWNAGKLKPGQWVTFKDASGNTVRRHIKDKASGKY